MKGNSKEEIVNALAVSCQQKNNLEDFLRAIEIWLALPLPQEMQMIIFALGVSVEEAIENASHNISYYRQLLDELINLENLMASP